MKNLDNQLVIDLAKLHNISYNAKSDNYSAIPGWAEVKSGFGSHSYGFHAKAFINEETKTISIIISGTTCFDENLLTPLPASVCANMSNIHWASDLLARGVGNAMTYGGKAIGLGKAEQYINDSVEHRTDCGYDWIANLQQFFSYEPWQLKPALNFTKSTLKILKSIDNLDSYKLVISGHSLGAVTADLVNLQLTAEKSDVKILSINFESPGAYNAMNYAAKMLCVDLKSLDITNFKMPYNWINSLSKQDGEVYEFAMPSFKGELCHNNANACHAIGAVIEAAEEGKVINITEEDAKEGHWGDYATPIAMAAGALTVVGFVATYAGILYGPPLAWSAIKWLGEVSYNAINAGQNQIAIIPAANDLLIKAFVKEVLNDVIDNAIKNTINNVVDSVADNIFYNQGKLESCPNSGATSHEDMTSVSGGDENLVTEQEAESFNYNHLEYSENQGSAVDDEYSIQEIGEY